MSMERGLDNLFRSIRIFGGAPPTPCAVVHSRHNGSRRLRTSLLLPTRPADGSTLCHGRRPPRGIVLDMDSSVSPTHGEQEMSVWNGHYASTCYHPAVRVQPVRRHHHASPLKSVTACL